MHFSSFLAPVLLLAGQMTMISAVLTPAELLNLIKEAVVDVNHDNNDALTITALNAVTKYSVRLFIHCRRPPTQH